MSHAIDPGHHTSLGQDHQHVDIAHPVPLWLLFTVFGVLLLLTGITVVVASFDFGDFNIWVALLVAVIKGGLVLLYFMHLRWDSPFNAVIIISALLFVALFLGTTIMDSHEYAPNYTPPSSAAVQ